MRSNGSSSGRPARRTVAVTPDHGPQLLGRRVGPRLLREAQPDAKDDHGAHDDGGAGIARRDGDAGEDGEEKNERVQARPREEPEAPVTLFGGHDVRAVFRKAARRFVFRETLRRRAEPFQCGGWIGLRQLGEKR
jgi:hypothetical protein